MRCSLWCSSSIANGVMTRRFGHSSSFGCSIRGIDSWCSNRRRPRFVPAAPHRPTRMPGEEALWRYKRGAARAALNRIEEAGVDLKAATSPSAQDWVRGRANVELARLAVRGGDTGSARDLALRAESLCEKGSDPACVSDARNVARSAGGR